MHRILSYSASSETLAANGVTAEAAQRIDDLSGSFELIVSNPPFHEGLHTTTATARALLIRSAEVLAPGGEVRIVANRFLPYERILEEAFGHSEVVTETSRFRVWRASRS